jgi:hypothetical protein
VSNEIAHDGDALDRFDCALSEEAFTCTDSRELGSRAAVRGIDASLAKPRPQIILERRIAGQNASGRVSAYVLRVHSRQLVFGFSDWKFVRRQRFLNIDPSPLQFHLKP